MDQSCHVHAVAQYHKRQSSDTLRNAYMVRIEYYTARDKHFLSFDALSEAQVMQDLALLVVAE